MPRASHGFTLIELLVTMAVAAVLLVIAVPNFADMVARRRLEGAVTELRNDLQFSRMEALRRNRNVTLAVNAQGLEYTVSYGGSAAPLKTVQLPEKVALTAGAQVVFSPTRGRAAVATDLLATSTASAAQLQVSVDALGGMQVCSPGGSFKGYPAC